MSPTYGLSQSFAREFGRLPREQRRAFRVAVKKLVDALREGREATPLASHQARPVRPIVADKSFRLESQSDSPGGYGICCAMASAFVRRASHS